jgi:hypothetical protein
MAVYAWICERCKHRAVQHRLSTETTARHVGLYDCMYCDCQMRRDDPTFGITRTEYERDYRPLEPKP